MAGRSLPRLPCPARIAAVATLLTVTSCGGTSAPTRPSPASPTAAISAALAHGIPVIASRSCVTWSAAGNPGIFSGAVRDAACPAPSGLLAFDAALAAPGVPANLMTSVNGSTVTLTWNANGNAAATTYVIEASMSPNFPTLVAEVDTVSTSFTATNVVAGTYYVRVRARNAAGTSAATSGTVVIVAGGPCFGPPSPPAALRFTRVGSQLVMEWNPAAGASEYVIEAGSVSGGTDIYVGSAGLATTFTALIPESTHAFVRVYARNACGKSLRGDEIEIGALWTVSFTPLAGLNANACVPGIANGGLCSQVVQLRAFGQFDEIWSPGTPVMQVRGAMTPSQFTATLVCLNGAASGTLQATWNGERYVGTGTLGGSSTHMRVTPGNYDPDCLTR